MPVVEAEPVAEGSTANDAASGPGLSPQARLDAARERERDLLGERPILRAAQRNAREALARAVRAFQDGAPKQTHECLPEILSPIASASGRREHAARHGPQSPSGARATAPPTLTLSAAIVEETQTTSLADTIALATVAAPTASNRSAQSIMIRRADLYRRPWSQSQRSPHEENNGLPKTPMADIHPRALAP